jgi:two-component system, NtrC family, sensor histidine kinase KinB
MSGIRRKLSLGFGGLLVIILIIGVQSIIQLTRLGASIDVILRENYRSVTACQDMKEALERMDSGILFTLLGYSQEGTEFIRNNESVFEKALQTELNNITLPGEGEKATHVQKLFERYRTLLKAAGDPKTPPAERQRIYFTQLFPLFQEIKTAAGQIQDMNQHNMTDANDWARSQAASSRRYMYILLVAGAVVAVAFVIFTEKWILRPVHRLIRSAEEIKSGNLDLVVPVESRDEVGRLSEAFNAMAEGLRQIRRNDQARLVRIQDSTQHTFNSLPDAVAILDLQGRVEVATESAKTVFGLRPGTLVQSLSLKWLADLYDNVLQHARPLGPEHTAAAIQHFDKGEERFFRPMVVPILDAEKQPTGVVMTLKDVTEQRRQDELKRGVISTVSHQLKTPLTSMRMAIHLLLEEKVGPLTEKQAELLVAAREDSDRLHDILHNLLDISRIESGKAQMEFHAVPPRETAMEALDSFRIAAKDQGVTLDVELPDDLPEVWADTTRIGHVFGNLLSNALRYTPAGGKVTVSARPEEDEVVFSIADTGQGIPGPYLPRIFEPFFRVPGPGPQPGAGLGLAIVREIVQAHGGRVTVDSAEGKGSTFSFTLRRVDPTSEKERSS